MSDYLANLAARTVEQAPALRPRLPGLFEPTPAPAEIPPAQPANRVAPAQSQPADVSTAEPPARPSTPEPAMLQPRLPNRSAGFAPSAPDVRPAPDAGQAAESITPVLAANSQLTVAAQDTRVSAPQPAPAPTWVQPALPVASAPARPAMPAAAARAFSPAPGPDRPQTSPFAEPKAPAATAPAPTIQVTIGRIEVRATPAAQPPQRQRSAPAPMSLEDYLRQRSRGGDR